MTLRRLTLSALATSIVGVLVLLALPGPDAEAVKPTPPAASSIVLDQPNPTLGDTVTFTTTYPKGWRNPRLQVDCEQQGVTVWSYSTTPDGAVLLGGASSDWLTSGGPASCRADLLDLTYKGQRQDVTWGASLTFEAGA